MNVNQSGFDFISLLAISLGGLSLFAHILGAVLKRDSVKGALKAATIFGRIK